MSPEAIDLRQQYPILEHCLVPSGQLRKVTPHIIELESARVELRSQHQSGLVLIVTGPPGGGKDSLVEYLMRQQEIPFFRPKTATTRAQRADEVENDPYLRVNRQEFEDAMNTGHFIETNTHFSDGETHYYGTPKQQISELLDNNESVILRVDPNGAKAMHTMWKNGSFFTKSQLVHCHIVPPTREQIVARLFRRAQQDSEKSTKQIKQGIADRIHQILIDLNMMNHAHYVLINEENQLGNLCSELVLLLRDYR